MKVKKIKHFSIFVTNLLELQLFFEFKRSFEILATKKAWQLEKIRQEKIKIKSTPKDFGVRVESRCFFKNKIAI
jgi:hypothetical protein